MLFKGAYVPGQGSVDVGVRGGRIDLVGRGEAGTTTGVIAADNCAFAAGLVNAPRPCRHDPAALGGRRPAAPASGWKRKSASLEAGAQSRRVYWGEPCWLIAEMIRSGTTTFTDIDSLKTQWSRRRRRRASGRCCPGLVAVGPGFDQAMAETREFVRT